MMISWLLLWASTSVFAEVVDPPGEGATVTEQQKDPKIPANFDAPFGSYPNMLNITQADLDAGIFHPVIVYPNDLYCDGETSLVVKDHRESQGLASPEDIAKGKRRALWRLWKRWTERILRLVLKPCTLKIDKNEYALGKYDENRVTMYSSEMFEDTSHTIDGFGGKRTVHLGIDLSAPIGTPVHAISDGIVHSLGYNADHGDYGFVVIIEHSWGNTSPSNLTSRIDDASDYSTPDGTAVKNRVWALYGHLDRSVLRRKRRTGDPVRKGEIVGRVGGPHENGGWKAPHVHFQLSVHEPNQPHDMPGASSVKDRTAALLQYPDPRYVLGPLY